MRAETLEFGTELELLVIRNTWANEQMAKSHEETNSNKRKSKERAPLKEGTKASFQDPSSKRKRIGN